MTSSLEFIGKRIARWSRYRQVSRELGMLSSRELSDLGISRGDIERIASQAADLG
jgi:uncharacterized protein YjiS (DUF1127 family)